MNAIKTFFIGITWLLTLTVQGQSLCYDDDPARFVPEKLVDYTHIEAHISVLESEKRVDGKVLFQFMEIRNEVDSVVLLAPGFIIKAVSVDSIQVIWYLTDQHLVVKLPRKRNSKKMHNLEINYTVNPKADLYFIGWDDSSNTKRKQIWAHRPYGWLPFANDRLTMDMYFTFNQKYQVFSNGERKSVVTNNDGTKTWHYQLAKEHPFFSTALIIGDYNWKEFIASTGVPVELWYYPDRAEDVNSTYMFMDEMMSFCETEFGAPYPYATYRQAPVEDYLYAGMETTTSTVFGDFLHIDGRAFWERNYVNVNIHELSHNWFGNDISHLRGKDVWLTESFATYYAKLFERSVFGENYYQWERQKEYQRVMKAADNDQFAVGSSRGGTERWYPKGSLVLDMLRDEMGDENFKKAVTYYLKNNQGSEVWTADFQKAIYESTGMSMDWFFDQWIERGGEPHYRIQYEDNGVGLLVKIEQIQDVTPTRPLFRAKLNFEVGYVDGSRKTYTFKNEQKEQLVIIPKDMPILYLLFDPGNRLLKKETFIRGLNDRFDQLLNTPKMIDRYRALLDLRDVPVSEKRDVYLLAESKNSFHLIKEEILKQLAIDTTMEAITLFSKSLQSDDVLVRRAALQYAGMNHLQLKDEMIECLKDTSYSNIILALKKLKEIDPKNLDNYLKLTANEKGFPGLNVRIAWLELAVNSGKTKHFVELKNYVSNRFDFKTRINAIEALTNLNQFDDQLGLNLVEAAFYWNFRLSQVAIKSLKDYSQNDERGKKIKELILLNDQNPVAKQKLLDQLH